MAIGARSKDLARQLTCESLVLAVAGGALGLLLAIWIVRVFVVLAANNLPRAATIHVDTRVLAFTAATSVVVGLVCGLWPLMRLRLNGAARRRPRQRRAQLEMQGQSSAHSNRPAVKRRG